MFWTWCNSEHSDLLQVAADEGILHASGSGVPPVTKDYCIIYNSKWVSLPKTLDNAVSSL